MAAIENLELIVDADISSALAKLENLQKELGDLAKNIEALDRRGDEGIDISSRVEGLEAELARMQTQIQTFEAANEIDIDTDVDDSDLSELFGAFDRASNPKEVFGRAGMGRGEILGTPQHRLRDSLHDAFANADLDFGGFNVARSATTPRNNIFGPDRPHRTPRLFRRLRRSVSSLTSRFDDFDIRMSDLHNLLAKMIPILIVFIGVVPAAATAIIGLAAAAISAASALVAIAGFGALGVGLEGGEFNMDNLTDLLQDVRDDFIEAFAPLAERLEPLFRDAIDGLDFFFQAVADQGDALMELTDEARAFGRFMTDWIPGVLRAMAAMAEAFAPVFADFADWLDEATILRDFTELTMEALPALKELTAMIVGMLPGLVRMSVGFTIVANAILKVLGYFGDLLRFLGISPKMFGLLTGASLAFASAIFILNSALASLVGRALLTASAAMFRFFYSLVLTEGSLARVIVMMLARGIYALSAWISSVTGATIATGVFANALMIAAGAAAALLTILTLGAVAATIVPMALSAASAFTGMSDSIDGATSSLKEFDRVAGRTEGNFNPYAGNNPPTGGGAAANGGGGARTVINIESSDDRHENRSNARYATFRQGRTTGSEN